jgi:hypothetical protein
MWLLDATTAAALIACMIGRASGQPAPPEAGTPGGVRISQPDEIVVTGRRDGGRYRLAPQFRTATEAGDRWRRSLAHDWSCRNVGPRGCGLQPNPLVAFRSDGSVRLGDHRSTE